MVFFAQFFCTKKRRNGYWPLKCEAFALFRQNIVDNMTHLRAELCFYFVDNSASTSTTATPSANQADHPLAPDHDASFQYIGKALFYTFHWVGDEPIQIAQGLTTSGIPFRIRVRDNFKKFNQCQWHFDLCE